MRISCLAAAVIMIAAGVVSALDGFGKLQTVSMILFGLLCAVFVAADIWTGKYVDKNAKREVSSSREAARSAHPRRRSSLTMMNPQ